MRKLILSLAFLLAATSAMAQVTADVMPNYTILRDTQGRAIVGMGVKPTANQNLGINVGMPFYDAPTYKWYWYTGTGWTETLGGSGGIGAAILSTLATNAPDAASSIWGVSNRLDFEGATADTYETEITATDPTGDRLFTLPDDTGTAMISTLATNNTTAANSVWGASNALVFEGATGGADASETSITVVDPTADNTFTLPNVSGTAMISTLATNDTSAANSIWAESNNLVFEGATGGADAFETRVTVVDPTADNTFTLPNYSGVPLISTYASNVPDGADSIWAVQGALYFEGSTANEYETVFTVTNPTADRPITVPDLSGEMVLSGDGYSKALSDAAATAFVRVAIPQTAGSNYAGGTVLYTIFCKDASNQAVQQGRVEFACHNRAGTEACGFGTPDGVTLGDGTASLATPTFDANSAVADTIDLRVNSDCTGVTPTTHTVQYRVVMEKANTLTPQ